MYLFSRVLYASVGISLSIAIYPMLGGEPLLSESIIRNITLYGMFSLAICVGDSVFGFFD